MFVIYGKRLFGRTDQVPGRFHVATRFFHVWYFPFFPLDSWCVVDPKAGLTADSAAGDSIKLPSLRWRSVLLAWARALMVPTFWILAVVAAAGIGTEDWATAAAGLLAVALLVTLGVVSYRATHVTPHGIDSLARAGVPDVLLTAASSHLAARTPAGRRAALSGELSSR